MEALSQTLNNPNISNDDIAQLKTEIKDQARDDHSQKLACLYVDLVNNQVVEPNKKVSADDARRKIEVFPIVAAIGQLLLNDGHT